MCDPLELFLPKAIYFEEPQEKVKFKNGIFLLGP